MSRNGFAIIQSDIYMADFLSPNQRSHTMSKVRGKDTKIERSVSSGLHKKGFRFRKNTAKLPGHPDIALTKYSAVIFIHGCFWHGHSGCNKSSLPTTRREFWRNKISDTIVRDKKKIDELSAMGWRIAIVWQCALKNKKSLSCTVDTLVNWITSEETWIEISGMPLEL